jgi:hypothetical protein
MGGGVAGVRVAVGVLPPSVFSSEVGSGRDCLAKTSFRVVDVGEVAEVPFPVRESPHSVYSMVVLGHGGERLRHRIGYRLFISDIGYRIIGLIGITDSPF